MIIHNTTSIPNALVFAIYQTVRPENVTISKISLRCKERNKISGNWGRFYAIEDRISICVPNADNSHTGTNIAKNGIKTFSPYAKLERNCNDLTEWLALVLGHELKHKWQFTNLPRTVYDCAQYIEVDAEMYESVALDKWRTFLKGN